MIRTISKIGDSEGITLDSALMELAHLKPGDDVNDEIHDAGTVTLIRPRPSYSEVSKVIKSTMKDYARTMKKLA